MLLRIKLLAIGVMVLGAPATSRAQQPHWTMGLDIGRATFGGTSRDTASGDDRSFRPADGTVWSLQASRQVGRISLGLVGSYASTGLALDGPDLLLVDRTNALTLYQVAPVVGVALTGLGTDGRLLLSGGPVVALWTITDQPDRTRLGAQLGLSLPVWFGRRLGGVARLVGVVTPSLFDEGELPPDFLLSATWRIQVSLGVLSRF